MGNINERLNIVVFSIFIVFNCNQRQGFGTCGIASEVKTLV